MPDSNGSRGAGSQCATRSRSIRNDRERVADADAARAWLQSQSWVAPDRVALLGWSSGAIAALWAVRRAHAAAIQDGPDFRSAVALLSGLPAAQQRRLERAGADLDLDRARRRPGLGRDLPADGGGRARPERPVEIHVYPGAHHDFDHPNRPLQLRTGLAFRRTAAAACTAAPIRPPAPTR
jgi:dienelactone hydrolase